MIKNETYGGIVFVSVPEQRLTVTGSYYKNGELGESGESM